MKLITVNDDLYVICGTVLVEKVITSTEELKKLYSNDSYKRKKEVIKRELEKRGKWES